MRVCEICGNALTNPRAKTCSTKCRTIKHRREKTRPVLDANEASTLQWFNDHVPAAGRALNELLAEHGKGALILAYISINEYANFLEAQTRESLEVERAS